MVEERTYWRDGDKQWVTDQSIRVGRTTWPAETVLGAEVKTEKTPRWLGLVGIALLIVVVAFYENDLWGWRDVWRIAGATIAVPSIGVLFLGSSWTTLLIHTDGGPVQAAAVRPRKAQRLTPIRDAIHQMIRDRHP